MFVIDIHMVHVETLHKAAREGGLRAVVRSHGVWAPRFGLPEPIVVGTGLGQVRAPSGAGRLFREERMGPPFCTRTQFWV